MATKGSVGWLILAFALAVPGVLFYQWYTHLDLEKKRALTTKVRLKDTDLFRNSPKQDKLVNPINSSAAPVIASTATSASPAPGRGQAAAPAGSAAASNAPAAAALRTPSGISAAAGTSADAGSASAPAAPAADDPEKPAPAPAANPYQAWRDPTLSPHDLVEIERMELEKQLALQELKDRAEHKEKPQAKAAPVQIEKLVELQGIVSVEGGNKAIVNNDVVAEGDLVKTKAGSVKVLHITDQKVVFSYRNRTFFKAVNR
jgi:hypothetical protein